MERQPWQRERVELVVVVVVDAAVATVELVQRRTPELELLSVKHCCWCRCSKVGVSTASTGPRCDWKLGQQDLVLQQVAAKEEPVPAPEGKKKSSKSKKKSRRKLDLEEAVGTGSLLVIVSGSTKSKGLPAMPVYLFVLVTVGSVAQGLLFAL